MSFVSFTTYPVQQIFSVAELKIFFIHCHFHLLELIILSIDLFGQDLHLKLKCVFV